MAKLEGKVEKLNQLIKVEVAEIKRKYNLYLRQDSECSNIDSCIIDEDFVQKIEEEGSRLRGSFINYLSYLQNYAEEIRESNSHEKEASEDSERLVAIVNKINSSIKTNLSEEELWARDTINHEGELDLRRLSRHLKHANENTHWRGDVDGNLKAFGVELYEALCDVGHGDRTFKNVSFLKKAYDNKSEESKKFKEYLEYNSANQTMGGTICPRLGSLVGIPGLSVNKCCFIEPNKTLADYILKYMENSGITFSTKEFPLELAKDVDKMNLRKLSATFKNINNETHWNSDTGDRLKNFGSKVGEVLKSVGCGSKNPEEIDFLRKTFIEKRSRESGILQEYFNFNEANRKNGKRGQADIGEELQNVALAIERFSTPDVGHVAGLSGKAPSAAQR